MDRQSQPAFLLQQQVLMPQVRLEPGLVRLELFPNQLLVPRQEVEEVQLLWQLGQVRLEPVQVLLLVQLRAASWHRHLEEC